jgi:bacteriorhodopsin
MYKDFDKDTIKEMQGIVTGHTAWYSTLVKLFFTPLFVYPVVFGLAVTRTIGPPLDNIFYSILDTIVKMGVTVVVFKAVGLNHTSTITPHLDSFIDPLQINTTTDDIQMMVDTMTENDDDADRIKEKSVVDL